VWLANEAPGVVPGVPAQEREDPGCLLVKGGTEVLARSDPRGLWVEWLA